MITDDLMSYTQGFVDDTSEELLLFSAYTTSEALREVLGQVDDEVEVKVITRWSREDIENGSSDLDVFRVVQEHDGQLFRHPSLHLKLFLKDKEEKIFGSANLTSNGLGISEDGNIENLSEFLRVTPEDILFVNKILKQSQKVSQEMVEEFRRQLEEEETDDWDESKLSEYDVSEEGIFVNDFPFTSDPEIVLENPYLKKVQHDKVIFDLPEEPTREDLVRGFGDSEVISWFDDLFDESMNFGSLSGRIHNELLDEPPPYRTEVKEIQGNLFNWIDELLQDKYEISVPGEHSQVITKKTAS